MFPESAVRRVCFIKRPQEVGFDWQKSASCCFCGKLREAAGTGAKQMRERAEAKIADIEDKLCTVRAMKNALARVTEKCPGCGLLSHCPILDALDAREVLA